VRGSDEPKDIMSEAAPPLLEVKDLRVAFRGTQGLVEAVRGIDLVVGREKLGIVGESGSGKTCTGRAVLRLLPEHASVSARRLAFDGINLLTAGNAEMRHIRGRRISMIMQDPKFSLNPVIPVGKQIAEAYLAHFAVAESEARERTMAMLESVRIRDPDRVYKAYPHELSGGMGQRVMIAMMLITDPDLLIADEPCSALDVTVQMQVLAIIDDLVQKRGMGLIFISHDLNLVASFCDRVVVMYGGLVVEACAASALQAATHPYTRGLLEAVPSVDRRVDDLPVLQRDPAWLLQPQRARGT
jgi:peptide/nickel transport system ATP-binding protein